MTATSLSSRSKQTKLKSKFNCSSRRSFCSCHHRGLGVDAVVVGISGGKSNNNLHAPTTSRTNRISRNSEREFLFSSIQFNSTFRTQHFHSTQQAANSIQSYSNNNSIPKTQININLRPHCSSGRQLLLLML